MAGEYSEYRNNLDGEVYSLPDEFTGSFREEPYTDGSEGSDKTRSNARIRALALIWMRETGVTFNVEGDPSQGPFIIDMKNPEQEGNAGAMRGGGGNIAVFSDCGYADDNSGKEGGELCDDDANKANAWDFFTDAFGDNIKTYFTPSASNNEYLPEDYPSLDLWQADGETITGAAANVVIVSDIVQLCAPTQYNQWQDDPPTLPEYTGEYVDVSTVFSNLRALTKPGGLLIFSVPYDGDPAETEGAAVELIKDPTTENGCGLWSWNYDQGGDNSIIKNKRNDGEVDDAEILNFTGGINCPAILRTFTRGAVYQYLTVAGFENIIFHSIDDQMNSIGAFWDAEVAPGKWTAKNSSEAATKSLIVTATPKEL